MRPHGVAALFGSFADAGLHHQGVGAGAEEGDGDEGPDFEGGAAGGRVWAGGVPDGGAGGMARGELCGALDSWRSEGEHGRIGGRECGEETLVLEGRCFGVTGSRLQKKARHTV